MSKSSANRNFRRTLVIGASALALGTSNATLAQQACGDGSPGPLCVIDNPDSMGPIVGTAGNATVVTNTGDITGNPAIFQGLSSVLYVDNRAEGLIDGQGGTAIQGSQMLGFTVINAGTIEGDVTFVDEPYTLTPFTSSSVRYVSDGGTLNGNLQLGSANGYTSSVFLQRGSDAGVTGTIDAGAGIDVYAKSYYTSQTIALGQYALPSSFEVEGYEVLGEDTVLTLAGSSTTIFLSGNGQVVNNGTIGLLDTTALYPAGAMVIPTAISFGQPNTMLYRREQIPVGAPGSFFVQAFGEELAGFTNNGEINGDIVLAAARFVNNGDINLASNSAGTAIYTAAYKAFLFRNSGSIVMSDAGSRPPGVLVVGEFFDGTDTAIRIQSAVDTTVLAPVDIDNTVDGVISGGLAFNGVASGFTFHNGGLIEIGDNPLGMDRAVEISLIGFRAASNPAFREEAVTDSVTITNSGTLDGGIEAEAQARAFSFTNTGQIDADSNDPYADAVQLAAYDWRDTPDGPDSNNGETFIFDNRGGIGGSVFLDAEASLVSIINSGTIEQGVRPGHGVVVHPEAADALRVLQETVLEAELIFENSDTISNEDYGGGAVTILVEAGRPDIGVPGSETADGTVTFTNSGSILASGGNYIVTPGNGGIQPGQIGIHFATAVAIDVDAERTSSISITNEAGALIDATGVAHLGSPSGPQTIPDSIEGAGGIAIAAQADQVTIINDGTIKGTSSGGSLVTEEATFIPLNLDLEFEGVLGGAIDLFDSVDIVTNSATGVIEGGIALRQGNDTLTNDGTIKGNAWLGSGDDTFTNRSLVEGDIDMGSGKDTLFAMGPVTGNITMGAGDVDIFITALDGVATRFGGTIDGGAGVGDNFIFAVGETGGSIEDMSAVTMTGFEYVALGGNGWFTSDGTAHGAIQLATGAMTFAEGGVFNASGTFAFLGDSPLAQNFTNRGTINGSVSLGTMDDRFANYGMLNGNIVLGEGNDTFIQGVNAILNGTANGGDGNDTFVLDLGTGGVLTSNIYDQLFSFEVLTTIGTGSAVIQGSDDTDQYNNQGTLQSDVSLGGGADTFSNTGTVNGIVDLGTGDNSFANAPGATINGNVTAGNGNDQVNNQGAINGTVDLGDGNNTFTNAPTGTVNGNLAAGTGNDDLTNEGTIIGNVYLDGGQQSPAAVTTFALRSPAAAPSGGNDTFAHSGLVTGDVDMGRGDDTLKLSGAWIIEGFATGGEGLDILNLTFGDGTSEEAPDVLDLAGFEEFETLEVAGGTGKVDGTATFDAIEIIGGRLIGAKNSLIAGDVTVHSGGTFGSAGTVMGDIVVGQGGTLSPGASPEVMTVIGDVSLVSGSITTFEFVPAPGQSDQMLIDGDLVIAPGAVLNMVGNRPLTPGVAYDLIVANDITGTFTIGTWDNSAIQGFLAYREGADGDRLQLLGTFVASGSVSPQAEAAIDYVNAVLIAGDASVALLNAVPDLLDGSGFADASAFARIGPEAYASAGQLGIERGLGISKAFRSGAGVPSGAEARPFTFAAAFGDWRTLDADVARGTSKARNETWGVLSGVGFGGEAASIAAFVGYLDSSQKIGALDARTDADGISAGAMGQVSSGGFHASAMIAYDWGKADTGRVVPAAAVHSAEYGLRSLVLDASVGYDVALSDGWALRPGAGVTHVSTRRGSAEEDGGAAFALDVEAGRHKATFIDAGLRLLGGRQEGAAFHPWAQVGVREQTGGGDTWASAGFAQTPARFALSGAARKDTVVTAGAGFALDLSPAARLFAAYQGEFGGGTGSNVSVGIEIGF
jgi:uncharacterized protein YhjY with autotransporter beta-barrel domain